MKPISNIVFVRVGIGHLVSCDISADNGPRIDSGIQDNWSFIPGWERFKARDGALGK